MDKDFKIIVVNGLFFGIAGSYIGGLIAVLTWSILTSSFSALHYFPLSPVLGFIPGSFTGFIYSLTYIKKKKTGVLIAGLYGCLVTAIFVAYFSSLSPTYTYDVNYKQSVDYISVIERAVIFSLLGAVCAIACAKLLEKWNKRTMGCEG